MSQVYICECGHTEFNHPQNHCSVIGCRCEFFVTDGWGMVIGDAPPMVANEMQAMLKEIVKDEPKN